MAYIIFLALHAPGLKIVLLNKVPNKAHSIFEYFVFVSIDFNEINDWINNLPALIEEDKRRINNMMRKMTMQTPPSKGSFINDVTQMSPIFDTPQCHSLVTN